MPEVSAERLEFLEHASRRLRCLLDLWSTTTGDSTEMMLAFIDSMLARGVSAESLRRYANRRRPK